MSQSARSVKQCPRGHTMDPTWTSCPYCDAEERAGRKSERPSRTSASGDRTTTVGTVPPPADDRRTRAMSPGTSPHAGSQAGQADTRVIVGVLVSYTWKPSGEIYPVREGKNFLGRGDGAGGDPSRQAYEIQVPHDENMSGEHALILCRSGNYEIIDQMSSNGTFVDGTMLKSNQPAELKNYSEIRTGATTWTFIKLHKPHADREEPQVHSHREEVIEERIIERRIVDSPEPDDDRETIVR